MMTDPIGLAPSLVAAKATYINEVPPNGYPQRFCQPNDIRCPCWLSAVGL